MLPAAFAGAYVTDAIGIHAVFGAFLVGTAMPRRTDVPALERLGRQLSGAIAVLAPIYFVTSGWRSTSRRCARAISRPSSSSWPPPAPGSSSARSAGARPRGSARATRSPSACSMNTRGLIEIVLLTVGRDAGLIDDRLFTLLALMAIVTTLLTSPVLRRIRPRVRDPVPA